MAQHSRIPKFGNWEDADTIQYTQYFETARKNRGTHRSINHNSLAHIPGIFTPRSEHGGGARVRPGSPSMGPRALRERRSSWDERTVRSLPHHRYWYEDNYVSSPSGGKAHLRTRDRGPDMFRQAPVIEYERGSALPKFGEWAEKGPSSADSYTRVFDRVREDKQIGFEQEPVTTKNIVKPNYNKQFDSYEPTGWLCFGWCKK